MIHNKEGRPEEFFTNEMTSETEKHVVQAPKWHTPGVPFLSSSSRWKERCEESVDQSTSGYHASQDCRPAEARIFSSPPVLDAEWTQTASKGTCSRRWNASTGLLDPDLASRLARDNSARRWSVGPLNCSLLHSG